MYANFAVFGSPEEANAVVPDLVEAGIGSSDVMVMSGGDALDDEIAKGKEHGFVTGPTEGRIRRALEGGSTLLAFKTFFGTTWRPKAVIKEAGAPMLELWTPPRTGFLMDFLGPMVFEYRPTGALSEGPLTGFLPLTWNVTQGLGIPLLTGSLLTRAMPLLINYKPRG